MYVLKAGEGPDRYVNFAVEEYGRYRQTLENAQRFDSISDVLSEIQRETKKLDEFTPSLSWDFTIQKVTTRLVETTEEVR